MKKLLLILIPLVLTAFCGVSAAEVRSCGEDAVWSLEDGVITVSGSGAVTGDNIWNIVHADKLVIESGITSIEANAFELCHAAQVEIAPTVKSIGNNAFTNCDFITVNIPESVEILDRGAFQSCEELTSVTGCAGLRSIGDYAFNYCDALEEISLTEGLESIGKSAFHGCRALKAFNIPKSVTSIGGGFLTGAYPESLTIDPENPAFCVCDNVIYSKDMTELVCYASGAESFAVPESVERIGERAFEDSKLTSVTLPKGLREIGAWAFYSLKAEDIEFPPALKVIGDNAFASAHICAAVLPEGIEYIGYCAFGSSWIQKLYIPDSVTSVGDYAFSACGRIGAATVPGSVKNLSKAMFAGCRNLKCVTLLEGVETVGDYAFKDCSYLKSIVIPEGVTSIGENAFDACFYLNKLHLPKSIRSIAKKNTRFCSEIRYAGTKADWEKVALGDTDDFEVIFNEPVIMPIAVEVNGRRVDFDVQPELWENTNRVMVPIRSVLEELGCTLEWSDVSKTATVFSGGRTIYITADEPKITYTENGGTWTYICDQPPVWQNEQRVLVPIRAIAECAGCTVEWIETQNLVRVTSV